MKKFYILYLASFCLIFQTILPKSLSEFFTHVYHYNVWHDSESASGTGSNMKQTEIIRREIPLLLKNFTIKTVLDAACGDFNWMRNINFNFLDKYIGIDIVQDLIQKNQIKYGTENRNFICLNIMVDSLPMTDIIICRDCLVHFSYQDMIKIIKNFKRSKSTYLLTTTFTRLLPNKDIETGNWRPLNLQLPPFNFPQPIQLINEGCTEKNKNGTYEDKCLGLWRLADLEI